MAMAKYRLEFEKDIYNLEDALAALEARGNSDSAEQIRRMRREIVALKKKIFSNLTAWQTIEVARHQERPQFLDYVDLIFEDYVELHGDRAIGDDRAIRTGFARIGDHRVMLVGHHKGRTTHERTTCFWGCAHPEGYRKALRAMKMAAKFRLPILCLIDTPGAFPGIGAEERGQAQLIAVNLLEMARLETPVICVVIGEGGSGGALGIGIGDRVSILEHAYYSVISPEGCAGILWKEANKTTSPVAADALKLTSRHLMKFGVIDDIIPEPLAGAHRDHREMATTLKTYLLRYIRELRPLSIPDLLEARYQKFRKMGVFETVGPEPESGLGGVSGNGELVG
jgi:acetyl-CoA carboxylase carboxyl transferase subunit alpha